MSSHVESQTLSRWLIAFPMLFSLPEIAIAWPALLLDSRDSFLLMFFLPVLLPFSLVAAAIFVKKCLRDSESNVAFIQTGAFLLGIIAFATHYLLAWLRGFYLIPEFPFN